MYGYPLEQAVPIAVETVTSWLEENRDYPLAVTMSCFNERIYRLYQEAIPGL